MTIDDTIESIEEKIPEELRVHWDVMVAYFKGNEAALARLQHQNKVLREAIVIVKSIPEPDQSRSG